MKGVRSIDPMEQLVRDGLKVSGLRFVEEEALEAMSLDFFLPDHGIHIEVKQFHSPRISDQMARVPNVIVAQGSDACAFLARLLAMVSP